ncbi:hypothetical protein F2Q70_00043140 [Brassica cretica]|uniref:Uncharacterized protein n=2 Tax=Brassica cretica TaxID=69181 RepID=A0A8S9KN30_BRACR|nr:hypothetical protein F2Q70_00043140 [Brassica cretica]
MVFHHIVLIFHSFKGFSDMEDFSDDLPGSRLKYNALEDFHDDLPRSLLIESSHMSPFHNRSERFGFSDMGLIYLFLRSGADFGRLIGNLFGSLLKYNALEDFPEVFHKSSKVFRHIVLIFHSFKGFSDMEDFWDDLPGSRLKYNALEDFHDDLPGSLLIESSPMSPFHNRSERFGFSDMGLIYMFLRSGADFGRLIGDLFGSLLKYNALEDFPEVFHKSSKIFHHMVLISHSFKGVSDLEDFWARRLPDDFQEVFQMTSRKRLLGSFSDDFQEVCLLSCLPFIIDLSVLIFNQMVLIFHLDISRLDFGRTMESLLGNLLKYNAIEDSQNLLSHYILEDFREDFQISRKSSRRLQRSLPYDFQEVF